MGCAGCMWRGRVVLGGWVRWGGIVLGVCGGAGWCWVGEWDEVGQCWLYVAGQSGAGRVGGGGGKWSVEWVGLYEMVQSWCRWCRKSQVRLGCDCFVDSMLISRRGRGSSGSRWYVQAERHLTMNEKFVLACVFC